MEKQIKIKLSKVAQMSLDNLRREIVEIISNKALSLCDELKKWYNKLGEWLGYNYLPSENDLNSIAYVSLNNKKAEESVKILNWALELYPNGINLYDSKAEMLENLSKKEDAINTLNLGLNKLDETKASMEKENYDYNKKRLGEHLERLNKNRR